MATGTLLFAPAAAVCRDGAITWQWPFGRADLGASDAVKFLAISGVSPWLLAVIICGIAGITVALVTRYFRLPASTTA